MFKSRDMREAHFSFKVLSSATAGFLFQVEVH